MPVGAAAVVDNNVVDDYSANGRRLRVLIVDDESEDLRRCVEQIVDASIVATHSVVEAIERDRPATYDLCLLGNDLSGLDGMTLGAMIRELNPEVRMVLIGGRSDPRIAELALEHGFHAVLTRPVRKSDLELVVNA